MTVVTGCTVGWLPVIRSVGAICGRIQSSTNRQYLGPFITGGHDMVNWTNPKANPGTNVGFWQTKWMKPILSKTFFCQTWVSSKFILCISKPSWHVKRWRNFQDIRSKTASLMVLLIVVYVMLKTQFSNTLSKYFVYFVCSDSAFLLRNNLHFIRLFDSYPPISLKLVVP